MAQPQTSRAPILFAVATVVAILALAVPWIETTPDAEPETETGAPDGSGEPPTPGEPVVVARPCDAEALARVAGLETGESVSNGWTLDAIACDQREECTRLDLSHAEEAITLRVCRHVEGAPLPPVTHAGSDVFFDSPRDPEAAVPEATVRAVLDAVVASMDGPAGVPAE